MMKRKLRLIGLIGLVGLCGCDQKAKERDAKVAKLEVQIVVLEGNMEMIMTNVQELAKMILHEGELVDRLKPLVEDAARRNAEVDRLVGEFSAPITNAPVRRPVRYAAQAQPAYQATRDGVPVEVYNQIAVQAAREWPGDYSMQAHTIKNQIEAYQALHP